MGVEDVQSQCFRCMNVGIRPYSIHLGHDYTCTYLQWWHGAPRMFVIGISNCAEKCVCGGRGVLSCHNCAPIMVVGACTAKLIVLTLTFLCVLYQL